MEFRSMVSLPSDRRSANRVARVSRLPSVIGRESKASSWPRLQATWATRALATSQRATVESVCFFWELNR